MTKQSKSPTSVNLREDHKEWMDSQSINRSELINELLEQYRKTDGVESDAIRRFRAKQLETQIDAKENEVSLLKQELEEIQSNITTKEERKAELWEQAVSSLRFKVIDYGDDDTVYIESPDRAVEDFADKLGMPVDEVRDELKRRYKEQ
jgi:seryl-tRNA(Sec) selenium transferase